MQDTQIILVHTDDAATFTRPTEHVEAGRDRLSTDIVALLAEHPEAAVVVLPEDRRFVGRIAAAKSGEEQKAFQALADRGAFLFDTSRVEDGEKARGVLYAYDFAAERMARVSTKSLLVPYGEYVPYSARLLARVLGFRSTVERIVSVRSSYVPTDFDARTRIVEWHGVSFGMLSCSEAFYPLHFKQIADAGADAIIVMSSQSWAPPDSKIVFNQTLGMAIVNTAWTGVPYLQATNRAPNIFVRRAAP